MAHIQRVLQGLFLATALAPLVVARFLLFPYNFSKVLYIQLIITLLVIVALALNFWKKGFVFHATETFRHPVVIALTAFIASATVSTFLARYASRALFSSVERGDGLYGLLLYALFAFVAALCMSRATWVQYFRLSAVVSLIVNLLAFLQYSGVAGLLPLGLKIGRPGSLFDNPAYLSTYVLWMIVFGLVLYFNEIKRQWKLVGLIAALSSFVVLFLADVRGGLVGLFVASLFACIQMTVSARTAHVKKFGILALSLAVVSIIVIAGTRSAAVWQYVPGLSRLVTVGISDSSMQTRLIALGSSINAFQEKPLLGWGLENFNVAYNRHYNPDYAVYEEAWFDRAHNKIADVAVMQGSIGLLTYMGLFVALFFSIRKILRRQRGGILPEETMPANKIFGNPNATYLLISAGLVAYFVQNLFLFDTPMGYVLFYSIIGLIICESRPAHSHSQIKEVGKTAHWSHRKRNIFAIAGGAAILFFVFAYYSYNIVPLRQMKTYSRLLTAEPGEVIVKKSRSFLEPYNFIQPTLRLMFLQSVSAGGNLGKPEFDPLTNLAIDSLVDVTKREKGYEPRHLILLAETHNEIARLRGGDPLVSKKHFEQAEKYLREALVYAPKRQDIYYLLAFSLAGQERFEEAVKVSREAVAFSPRVGKAHYNLGLELVFAGREYWDEALQEFEQALDIGFLNIAAASNDLKNISLALNKMLQIYIPERDATRTIRAAKILGGIDTELSEDMKIIISYAEKNDWQGLFRILDFSPVY